MSIFDLFKQIESEKPKTSGTITHLVVGLGNPGDKYANTRHNAGFLSIDKLAESLSVKINKVKFKALISEATIGKTRVLLMKPQTFMNLSGEAVKEASSFYKIPPENIIVMCDDISLPEGKLRIRAKGSHGGQNGLRNIIDQIGSNEFPRIKIGIGAKPHPDYDLADWVLSPFRGEEVELMKTAFDNTCKAVTEMVNVSIASAMNKFNGK